MKLYSPAWIIAAGVVLVQASGILSTAGSALIGIDNAVRATIDFKTVITKLIPPPKFVPIKKVVIPTNHVAKKDQVKQ